MYGPNKTPGIFGHPSLLSFCANVCSTLSLYPKRTENIVGIGQAAKIFLNRKTDFPDMWEKALNPGMQAGGMTLINVVKDEGYEQKGFIKLKLKPKTPARKSGQEKEGRPGGSGI
jgi:hypothetical protein